MQVRGRVRNQPDKEALALALAQADVNLDIERVEKRRGAQGEQEAAICRTRLDTENSSFGDEPSMSSRPLPEVEVRKLCISYEN